MPGFSGLSPVQPAPRRYVLPAGGAYVDIPATIFARTVEIAEDGALAAFAGFTLKFSNGVVVGYSPEQQPAKLGDKSMNRIGAGNFLGMPLQDGAHARPADLYCQAASAAGTTINVWEYE